MWNGSVWAGQVGLCKDQTTLKCPECKWTSCEFHIFTLHQLHFWLVHSRIHSNATEQKPENVIIRPYPFLSFSFYLFGGCFQDYSKQEIMCGRKTKKGLRSGYATQPKYCSWRTLHKDWSEKNRTSLKSPSSVSFSCRSNLKCSAESWDNS